MAAPVVLQHTDAGFTEVAEALGYSGSTVVSFVVETDGKPAQLSISKPCGLGLDEKALIAVQSYRFTPATENGQPVRVESEATIGFRIH